jgi:hypothetical protein
MRPARLAAAVTAAVLAGACTISVGDNPTHTAGPSKLSFSPLPPASGPLSAAQAMRSLCPRVQPYRGGEPPQGPPPPEIAEVEHEVELVRGLEFLHRVAAEPVGQEEIDRRLADAFDQTYPVDFYARRTAAWRTIGVIPPEADIRSALNAFQQGQVVGFYNPQNGELVYIGDQSLDVTERFVLAHELTHALDDQHFDLKRLDRITTNCRDETLQAALGAVEGNAQFSAGQVLIRFPAGTAELQHLVGGVVAAGEIPEFIQELQGWPYTVGRAFIGEVSARGGTPLVDRALERFPVSTEQIIHPDRWPNDAPTAVDVPDLGAGLGEGWRDLDVMDVGEAWLQIMLALRLSDEEAAQAATGWDGGVYRAWTDGKNVGVGLRTVWDSKDDAQEFQAALSVWIGNRTAAVSAVHGVQVDAVFATSSALLDRLTSPDA